MSTYLKAATEILTFPGGPSRGMVEGAIAALQAHLETLPAPSAAVTLEDRVAEQEVIARAEGWIDQDDDEFVPDEDGEQAYMEWVERRAEMAVQAEEAMYGPGWGVEY